MSIDIAQLDAAQAEYQQQLEGLKQQAAALAEQQQQVIKTMDMLIGALAAIEALRQLPPAQDTKES